MGADLCISYFAISEKVKEDDYGKIVEKMLKKVDNLNLKDYKAVMASLNEMGNDNLEEIEDEDKEKDLRKKIVNILDKNSEKLRDLRKAKKIYRNIIKETFDSLINRDVTWIYHKGDRIFLSGGMSWGDAPTDTYETFNKFSLLPKKILNCGGIR